MLPTLYALLEQGGLALTASQRLAHRLRQRYAVQAERTGKQAWRTPKIIPWTQFVRTAFYAQRHAGQITLSVLDEPQAEAIWERIIAASPLGQQLLNPRQTAYSVARSWQRLQQYQIPLHVLQRYPSDETAAFIDWARQFIDYTQQQHCIDHARLTSLLQQNHYVPDAPVCLLGFDCITPAMQALLQQWREQGQVIHELAVTPATLTVQVIAAQDADTELHQAACWARQQVQLGKKNIGVVVPQLSARATQVQRIFTAEFSPAAAHVAQPTLDVAVTVAVSPALSRYPLVQHALLLLRLAWGQVDTLQLGQLLRSPFFCAYDQEASQRALIDLKARERYRDHWDQLAVQRLLAGGAPVFAAALNAMATTVAAATERALPSQWTEYFNHVLTQVGWAQGRPLSSAELQTRNKFYEVLALLSQLDRIVGAVSVESAQDYLAAYCERQYFAPESAEQSVLVIDPDTSAGMEFEALWVTGMHAGEWPATPDPDPYLPVELQWQYGMPTARADTTLAAAQQRLQRLVSAAPNVILSWPHYEADLEYRPSALLSMWAHTDAAKLQLPPARSLSTVLWAQRPLLESIYDERAPPYTAVRWAGGTRAIELQSNCPFRAQAEIRLNAQPVPTVSFSVTPQERGILMHQVLAQFWQHVQTSANLCAISTLTLQQQVQHIAARVAQHSMPADSLFRQRLVALEVLVTTQRIMELLALEKQRAPFRIMQTEYKEPFELAGVQFNIQPDRIDALEAGGTLLLDYKTGDQYRAADWLDSVPGRPRSPQLPLYALAQQKNTLEKLVGISFVVLAPGAVEFRGVADNADIAPGVSEYAALSVAKQLSTVTSWEALLTHWQAVLQALATQFVHGDATVDPLQNACTYCHLAGLCRVRESLDMQATLMAEGTDD